jgi:hypothetical protein
MIKQSDKGILNAARLNNTGPVTRLLVFELWTAKPVAAKLRPELMKLKLSKPLNTGWISLITNQLLYYQKRIYV